ncbi:DUF4089 domain-containing protein [Synechococcus sp. Nb3U1]|uniref:DUF4089 domain-containing protein n=1 Tax=Synechococcus sp. Nb3U1 TaxID=1914529 RepID=UPI001F1C692D|nr:DUF4089 domain-containing protein [Synechococcus sp. Nb3U1]MCF2970720.1 DUF4089 domain-containing protein [Synechococcus sp. Nb3U1]
MEGLDPEVYVDSVAKALQLPLHPDHRPGVIENFARILPIAKLVLEFPLPQTVEPAPTFDPLCVSGTEFLP